MVKEATTGNWCYRHRASITFVIALLLIVVMQTIISNPHTLRGASANREAAEPDQTSDRVFQDLREAAYAPVPDTGSLVSLPPKLQTIEKTGDTALLKKQLLALAMQAVLDGNELELANTLTLLGQSSLAEWDTESSSVYLNEALAIYEYLDDVPGTANVNLQLGRMYIIERRRARRAALAHDTTLVARWYIANDRFYDAEPALKKSIEENLALNRHGAAAEGWQALSEGYRKSGDLAGTTESAIQASLLHASSGRVETAHSLLDRLELDGVSQLELGGIRTRLGVLNRQYEESINQLGQARDYDRLYNHYISAGDPVSAWRFRLQANASLSQSSKRARYRRQSGVLGLLYDSNDSMQAAKQSLLRSAELFETVAQQETFANASNLDNSNLYIDPDALAAKAKAMLVEIY